jgi:signal transduction histidine kinase
MTVKPNKSYYLKRFFLVITICAALIMVVLFFISISIALNSFSGMNESDIHSWLDKGGSLLSDYASGVYTKDELNDILNPKLNMDNEYLVLIDAQNQIIAANQQGRQYVNTPDIPALTQKIKDSGFFKLSLHAGNGEDIPNIIGGEVIRKDGQIAGYVFAGKILKNFDLAIQQYRISLLMILICMLVVFIFPGYWISKRLSEPTRVLTNAAMRLAQGDLHVRIDKKLKGEMGQIAAAFNDMSDRLSRTILELGYQKKSIELILEGLTEGIVAIDSSYIIIRENNAVSVLFNDKSSHGYAQLMQALKNCIRTGNPSLGKIQEGERVLQWATSIIFIENQVVAVALVRDITQNERLEKTRHDYVANISHELRTPLSSMRGLIEALRDGVVNRDSDRARYYAILSGEVLRLSRLVNDLLELSGLQSSTAAFEMESIDVREMMLDMHDRYKKMFDEQKKEFKLQLPPEAFPGIRSNDDRLTQVLTIFLDNAIKYTQPGGHVELGARMEEGRVYFYVADNGMGMEEGEIDKIFDRFYQAEISRSDKGNGLGLSIAKEILDKLSLQVRVRSSKGQGSEFGFFVPVS